MILITSINTGERRSEWWAAREGCSACRGHEV